LRKSLEQIDENKNAVVLSVIYRFSIGFVPVNGMFHEILAPMDEGFWLYLENDSDSTVVKTTTIIGYLFAC